MLCRPNRADRGRLLVKAQSASRRRSAAGSRRNHRLFVTGIMCKLCVNYLRVYVFQ